jgi:DNA-binding Lrp family transcriptional regulator
MKAFGYATQRALAEDLGLSPSDLNNRAKSGTIKNFLVDYCLEKNLSIDKWALLNEEDQGFSSGSGQGEFGKGWSEEIKGACETLAVIMKSDDEVTKAAIATNLHAFIKSVEKDERIKARDDKIDAQEIRIKNLEDKIERILKPSLNDCDGDVSKKSAM